MKVSGGVEISVKLRAYSRIYIQIQMMHSNGLCNGYQCTNSTSCYASYEKIPILLQVPISWNHFKISPSHGNCYSSSHHQLSITRQHKSINTNAYLSSKCSLQRMRLKKKLLFILKAFFKNSLTFSTNHFLTESYDNNVALGRAVGFTEIYVLGWKEKGQVLTGESQVKGLV